MSPPCCTFIQTFFQCSVTMRLAAKIAPNRFALFSSFVPQNYTQPLYAVILPSFVRYSTFPKSQVYTCWKLKSFYLKYSWTRHGCRNWMRRQASNCYRFGNRTVFGRNANLVFILPSKGNIRNYVIVIWSVLSFLLMPLQGCARIFLLELLYKKPRRKVYRIYSLQLAYKHAWRVWKKSAKFYSHIYTR